MDTEILQYPLHRSEYRWIVRNKQTFKCHFWFIIHSPRRGPIPKLWGSALSFPRSLRPIFCPWSQSENLTVRRVPRLVPSPRLPPRRQRLLRRTRLGSVPFHSPFASTCCHQPRGLISKRLPFYVVRTQTAKASVNGALMFKGLRSVSSAARTESGQPFLFQTFTPAGS